MEVSDKIAMLLAKRGMSQADLSRQLGVGDSSVSKWATGNLKPPALQFLALARVLGTTADFLIDDSQDTPPAGLSEDERVILRVAKAIGYDESICRLTQSRLALVPAPVELPPVRPVDLVEARKRKIAEKSRVYFIEDRESLLIKIGVTSKIRTRFDQIRLEHPKIRLIALLRGGREVEREIHDHFKDLRVRGEWFLPSPLVYEFAAANACRN